MNMLYSYVETFRSASALKDTAMPGDGGDHRLGWIVFFFVAYETQQFFFCRLGDTRATESGAALHCDEEKHGSWRSRVGF